MKKAITIDDSLITAKNLLVTTYRQMDENEKALEIYSAALDQAEMLDDKPAIGDCLSNIGTVSLNKSEYEKSLDYYNRALKIREELGLAYYVGTQNFTGRIPGFFSFYAGTARDTAEQVESELLSQAKCLAKEGLSEDELCRAKAKLIGHRKIARQDLGNVAFATCMDELLGLGYDHYAGEDARIEAVTLSQVREIANRYLGADNFATAISLPSK